jgi:hypothetical protein
MADYTPSDAVNVFVGGIKLVAQPQSNLCWYASLLMMYNWKLGRGGSAPDPYSNDDITRAVAANAKLGWDQTLRLAQQVGMRPRVMNKTPSVSDVAGWLTAGPQWTNGVYVDWSGKVDAPDSGHVTVLAGLRSVPSSDEYEVFVYDPWPPNTGHAGWRPIAHLGGILSGGAQPDRDAQFLCYA